MALYKQSQIAVRPAKPEEVELLQKDLASDSRWEQVDLRRSVVGVVTLNDEIVMYGSARLVWQVEPIKFVRGKKSKLTRFQQKKATFLAIRWITDWLLDINHNPYIRFYFCGIANWNSVMQKLAVAFGMKRLYRGVSFFGRDL